MEIKKRGANEMLGKELKLLITINEVKAYDVARVMGVSQSTITRICQPSRKIATNELKDVVAAIKTLKNNPLVTGVDFSENILADAERGIKLC